MFKIVRIDEFYRYKVLYGGRYYANANTLKECKDKIKLIKYIWETQPLY